MPEEGRRIRKREMHSDPQPVAPIAPATFDCATAAAHIRPPHRATGSTKYAQTGKRAHVTAVQHEDPPEPPPPGACPLD